MKITPEAIARTALRLLDDVGLDGLTMRLVAGELGVQAPALYWHVKNKQELLDAMAGLMLVEAVEGMEMPGRGVSWSEWLGDAARRLRRMMLRHRDGARVVAGTHVTEPTIFRVTELALRTMRDAGFPLRDAARAFPALLHYTVGFTIEEQARTGAAYGEDNPYGTERFAASLDAERFPLTAQALDDLFDADSDAGFEYGLRILLAGMRAALAGE
ncbi:TetR/AcrR family transcriptional regulator C-terminal domain-containing protein [Streptosporangium carneum]|uniref:Transcriptional regulator, TetR family n=1 Tax=Streptosporangium carneum TaxID=47481 RepID=A0A9W6HZ78_9ACTN|nr:TetR/AcrR family transcriptional regulator C-terminal domain-containing protein [Streptosporangium carneum]GLK08288.1 putative transcriptional regulator, TetR family [Streptosporangium carneum]